MRNARVFHRCGFLDMPLSEWERIFNSNLTIVFLCTRIAVRHMLKNA
ncbi:MAG: hypothetical protein JXQ30_03750 [Spirochaetes bacterium]|nr:hypothetical protein [Spirochaetota bacterium]